MMISKMIMKRRRIMLMGMILMGLDERMVKMQVHPAIIINLMIMTHIRIIIVIITS